MLFRFGDDSSTSNMTDSSINFCPDFGSPTERFDEFDTPDGYCPYDMMSASGQFAAMRDAGVNFSVSPPPNRN